MASKIQHFKNVSIVEGDVKVDINLKHFEHEFANAQYWLDGQIMTDMLPLMPLESGMLIDLTRIKSTSLQGTGVVCAAYKPYGRYLYMGKVMVNKKTGKGPRNIPGIGLRYKEGTELEKTDRPLHYGNPSAVPMWFDEAKKMHLQSWVDGVKERLIGEK